LRQSRWRPARSPALDQSSGAPAEAILFLADTGNSGAGTVDQQAAQILKREAPTTNRFDRIALWDNGR
jgi:hypothetical protein